MGDAGEENQGTTEPFVTLSASSPSSSSAGGEATESPNTSPEESFDDSPLATPPVTTHDTRKAEFHVKDLETFAKNLQNAADRAFPNEGQGQSRYSNVSVLLLKWEDDEMNVEWELDDLEKVFRNYGFGTERWHIPTKSSHLKLMSKVVDVVEEHDGDGGLVIVYYAGHAGINSSRGATWTCKSDPKYASLEWTAIQTLFEKADFDVLLLLDCCAAASAAPTAGSAVTETIAACGFESIAPQPGRHSFTNALIDVLEDWVDGPPFSAAMLHNKVLSVLKHEQPERTQSGKRRKLECRRTPVHMVATADPTLPSVELRRRAPSMVSRSVGNTESSQTNDTGLDVGKPGLGSAKPSSNHTVYHRDTVNEVQNDEYNAPRVIISLSLERNQRLNSESCQKWLTSCPTIIKYATVEAVFNSFSALVLLSIPVMIWNLLPDDPACSFVGYATSPNILKTNADSSPRAPVANATSELYSSCHRCRRMDQECNGVASVCTPCRKWRSSCVYGPIDTETYAETDWNKGYADEIQNKHDLKSIDIALKEQITHNNMLSSLLPTPEGTLESRGGAKPSHFSSNHYQPGLSTNLGFQGSMHTGYKTSAAAYDNSLLQKLGSTRGSVSNRFPTHAIPPAPHHEPWEIRKLSWIGPKLETIDMSASPILKEEDKEVKSEPRYDPNTCKAPPEKKRRVLPFIETSHPDSGYTTACPDLPSGTCPVYQAGKNAVSQTRTSSPLPDEKTRLMSPKLRARVRGISVDPSPWLVHDWANRGDAKIQSHSPSESASSSTVTDSLLNIRPSAHSPINNLSINEQQLHETLPPAAYVPTHAPITNSNPQRTIPDQDWTFITDIAERRRIQNRIAQRNYRKRMKNRLQELEERAGGSASQSNGASVGHQQYSLSNLDRELRGAAALEESITDSKPMRAGLGDTMGRHMPKGGIADLDDDGGRVMQET